MPRPLPQLWLVTAVPKRVVEARRVLAASYSVSVLTPEAAAAAPSGFPALLVLHFSEHLPAEYSFLTHLRQAAPDSRVYVLGKPSDQQRIIDAYDRGADGYFLLPLNAESLTRIPAPRPSWRQRLKYLFAGRRNRPAPVPITADTTTAADLNVRFFGDFRVTTHDGREIILNGPRMQAVFAGLLYAGRKGITRQALIRDFWPDTQPDCARNSLNVAVSQLRGALKAYFGEREVIVLDRGRYAIHPDLKIASDANRFQFHLTAAKTEEDGGESTATEHHLLAAVELYRGDFLAGVNYHEWPLTIRDRLSEHYLFVLGKLVAGYLKVEIYAEAIRYARMLIEEDPYHELTHRQLMYAYYRLGRRTCALRQYQRCRTVLLEDLDVPPSRETEAIYQIIVKQQPGRTGLPFL